MTRFFITLEQGVDYVVQYLNIMKGERYLFQKLNLQK